MPTKSVLEAVYTAEFVYPLEKKWSLMFFSWLTGSMTSFLHIQHSLFINLVICLPFKSSQAQSQNSRFILYTLEEWKNIVSEGKTVKSLIYNPQYRHLIFIFCVHAFFMVIIKHWILFLLYMHNICTLVYDTFQ